MQANDIHSGYDDRDDFELAQARLAYKKHTKAQTYFVLTDLDSGARIDSSGKHTSMLAAYLAWWRTFRNGTGRGINFRMTLFDGSGRILRRVTLTRQ